MRETEEKPTTSTRRSALLTSLAAITTGLATPALAKGVAFRAPLMRNSSHSAISSSGTKPG